MVMDVQSTCHTLKAVWAVYHGAPGTYLKDNLKFQKVTQVEMKQLKKQMMDSSDSISYHCCKASDDDTIAIPSRELELTLQHQCG
jgi:hypothetical protein